MDENYISVIDTSKKLGINKQTVFKWLKKLKIQTSKSKNSLHKGQAISYINISDLELLIDYKSSKKKLTSNEQNASIVDQGYFYLIQLEPKFDPGRFKLGFATNVAERLRSHKCSAPFAKIIEAWPSHSLWEKTAIDSVTRGCEKLYTEVFRFGDLQEIKARCQSFFEMMPELKDLKR